jgi:hypothetical protein
VHLISVVVLALPASARLGDKSHWDAPRQQTELTSWANRLGVDKEDFEAFLWRNTQRYVKTRAWIARPFLRYADYSGSRQGWTMFANPRLVTGRFEVAVEMEGEWQLVWRAQDPDADWNQWQFEHNRVRKLMGRLATKPHQVAYNEFTNWIVREVAQDFPGATRAKITLMTWKSLEPDKVRAGEKRVERRTQYQEFTLEDFR